MIAATVGSRTVTLKKHDARPQYEIRMTGLPDGNTELEVWELPSPATPRLLQPERVAGLHGRNLLLVETRLLRRLRQSGISLPHLRKGESKAFALDEDLALNLALLFRVLAPMRSEERIRAVVEGIEKMPREEAGYWMGMAVHRVNPRRVLAALRILLAAA
jgi:hypothetical protein